MPVVFQALGAISFVLLLLVLVFLLQGQIRKYPLVFVYALCQISLEVVEYIVGNFYGSMNSRLYYKVYWADEIVLNLLLFLMVIALTYRAMEGNPVRPMVGRMLGAVVLVVLVLPFVLFRPWFGSGWLGHTSELFSFGGAILNLFLWTALIGSRKRDPRLLMVSAGLGVAVTGAAISYGVRALIGKDGPLWLPNIFLSVTHLVCVFLWCWAFRPARKSLDESPTAVTSA